MNPDNYASLEAARRLHEKGIVIETEKVWAKDANTKTWQLMDSDDYEGYADWEEILPAPSLTEIWRKLPVWFNKYAICFQPHLVKVAADEQGIMYSAFYANLKMETPVPACYQNTNPADAAIDLLIWVTQRKEATDAK